MRGPGELGSVPGRVVPKTLKWYLISLCLILSNIRYVSRVKWTNPGKGVAPSPTPQCSSYWKREPSGHRRLRSQTLLVILRLLYNNVRAPILQTPVEGSLMFETEIKKKKKKKKQHRHYLQIFFTLKTYNIFYIFVIIGICLSILSSNWNSFQKSCPEALQWLPLFCNVRSRACLSEAFQPQHHEFYRLNCYGQKIQQILRTTSGTTGPL